MFLHLLGKREFTSDILNDRAESIYFRSRLRHIFRYILWPNKFQASS